MSYAPGAPAQIWALTGVSDGAKLLALWWWGKADHDVQRDPRPCTVWAPAGTRADGSRMTPHESLIADMRDGVHPKKAERTLRGYMVELDRAGLASVDGRCVDLVPPDLAVLRQDPAAPRRKSAGENPPSNGVDLPWCGENPPSNGENPPSHSYPPCPPSSPHEPPTDVSTPAPAEGHPCTVLDSPGVTPASIEADDPEPPSPPQFARGAPAVAEFGADQPQPSPSPGPSLHQPREPRRRKSVEQAALDLDGPDFAELLDMHERLRNVARAAHGLAPTPLPSPSSGKGRALRMRLRKALGAHGVAVCRRALEFRGREWAEDPGACELWSAESMWSPKSLKGSIPASARGQPRASPRTLPVEPNAPCRELSGFTWTEPTP